MGKQASLSSLSSLYSEFPEIFTEEEISSINSLLSPSAQRRVGQTRKTTGDFDLLETLGQVVDGFIEGFTTIDTGIVGDPNNVVEHISRSIGHLLGFIGIIPGVGTAASAGVKGSLTVGKLVGKALFKTAGLNIGREGLLKAAQFTSAHLTSVPMMISNAAMKYAGLQKGANLAKSYLASRGLTTAANVTGRVLESGLHLGIASGVSDWRNVIDGNMNSIAGGFLMGGFAGATGELLPTAQRELNANIWKQFASSMKDPKGVARIVSNSLFMGMPATLSNAPAEIQIYDYLLGAYFGTTELSTAQKDALRYINRNKDFEAKIMVPESIDPVEYAKLTPEAKREVDIQSELSHYRLLLPTEQRFTEASSVIGKMQATLEDKLMADAVAVQGDPAQFQAKFNILLRTISSQRMSKLIENELDKKVKELAPQIEAGKTTAERIKAHFYESAVDKAIEANKAALTHMFDEMAVRRGEKELDINAVIHENLMKQYHPEIYEKLLKFDDYVVNELKLDGSIIHPIKEIARLAVEHNIKNNTLGDQDPTEQMITLAGQVAKDIAESKGDWTKLESTLKTRYNVVPPTPEKDSRVYRHMRAAYKRMQQEPAGQLIYIDNSRTLDLYDNRDITGNKTVTQYKDNDWFRNTINSLYPESTFRNIKKRRVTDEETGLQQDIDFWDPMHPVNINEFIHSSLQQGWIVFGGAKADSNILTYKSILSKEEAATFLSEFEGEVAKNPQEFKEYQVFKEQINKDLPQDISIEDFNYLYANNIKLYQSINRISDTSTFVKYFLDGTIINTPVALTKRLSLLNNGFLRASDTYLPQDAKEGLNTIIIKTGERAPSLSKQYEDIYYNVLSEDGRFIKQIKANQHYDGVIYLRDDIYDAMAQDFGWYLNTSAQKGSLLHAGDSNEGLLIGKYAYHRANKAISAEMKLNNIHTLLYDTAAKQKGNRKLLYMQWDTEGAEGSKMNFIDPDTDLPVNLRETGPVARETGIPTEGQVPTTPLIPSETIAMNFGDGTGGRVMRPEFRGKSTMDLILSGDRIGTSRDYSKSYNQLKSKIGEIVKFTDNKGRSVLAKITSEPIPIKNINREVWSKREGWSPELYDKLIKMGDYRQFTFEVLNKSLPSETPKVPTTPLEEVSKGGSSATYKIPVEAFTGTDGGEHEPGRRIRYASQLLSGMDERLPQTREWIESLYDKAYHGEEAETTLIGDYLFNDKQTYIDEAGKTFIKGTSITKYVDDIEWSKVGVQYKLDILTQNRNDGVFRSFVNYLLKESNVIDIDDIISKESFDILEHKAGGGAAERAIELAKDIKDGVYGLSPAALNSKPIAKWLHQVVSYQFMKEISRPFAENAWISVFQPYRPDLFNMDLKPGEALLGEGSRGKEIEFLGKKVTIEKALDRYNKEKDPKQRQLMEEDLEVVVQRSPTDSPSGVRTIRIKGFSGNPGEGVILHPEDMANLGGADLDIDKGFIYLELPKDIRKELKTVASEWYDYYEVDRNNQIVYNQGHRTVDPNHIPRSGNSVVKVFKEPKSAQAIQQFVNFQMQPESRKRAIKWNAFNPYIMAATNQAAYEGNHLLGPAINAAKIVLARLEHEQNSKNPRLIPKQGARDAVAALKRSIINLAADASDGSLNLVKGNQIYSVLMKAAFEPSAQLDAEIFWVDGFTGTKHSISHAGTKVSPNPFYKLNSAINAKWKGQGLTLENAVMLANDTNVENLVINNPFFQQALRLKDLDVGRIAKDRMEEVTWLGRGYLDYAKQVTALFRDDITIRRLIGRNVKTSNDPTGFYGISVGNSYKTAVNSPEYQKAINDKDYAEASRIRSEFASQDVADLANMLTVLDIASKVKLKDGSYNWEIIEKIQESAQDIKDQFQAELELLKQHNKKVEFTRLPIGALVIKMDTNRAQIRKMWAKTVGENYARLFDAYTFSSLNIRRENLPEYVDKYIKLMTNGDSRQISETQYQELYQQATKNWWTSNWSNYSLGWQSIHDGVIKTFYNHYNKIANVTQKELTKNEIKHLIEMVEDGRLTLNLSFPDPHNTLLQAESSRALFAEQRRFFRNYEIKDKELKQAYEFLLDYYYKHPEQLHDLEAVFIGSTLDPNIKYIGGITPNLASKQDILRFTEQLKILDREYSKPRPVFRTDYYRKMQAIGEDIKYSDPIIAKQAVPALVSLNKPMELREAAVIESTATRLYEIHNRSTLWLDGLLSKIDNEFNSSNLKRLYNVLDDGPNPIASKVFTWIVRYRELGWSKLQEKELGKKSTIIDGLAHELVYEKYWEEVKKDAEAWLADTTTKTPVPYLKKSLTNKEIWDYLDKEITAWWEKDYNDWVYNNQAVNDFFRKNPKAIDKYGYVDTRAVMSILSKQLAQGQMENYSQEFWRRIYHQELLENIHLDIPRLLRDIEGTFTTYKDYADIKANSPTYKKWLSHGGKLPSELMDRLSRMVHVEAPEPRIRDLENRTLIAEELHRLKQTPFNENNWMEYQNQGLEYLNTRFHTYWSHMDHNSKEWIEATQKNVQQMASAGLTQDKVNLEHMTALNEVFNNKEDAVTAGLEFDSLFEKKPITEKQLLEAIPFSPFEQMRNRKDPTPGWSTDIDVIRKRIRKDAKLYAQSLASYLARKNIVRWQKGEWNPKTLSYDKPMGEYNQAWAEMFGMYNRANLGRPSLLSDEALGNKALGLRGNPAYYLMDDFWRRRLADISTARGMKQIAKLFPELTPEMYDKLPAGQQKAIKTLIDNEFSRKIDWLSQLDAKWNLISLLTHTKTMVNNLTGGNLNTINSVGLSTFRETFNTTRLIEKYFPDFKSKDDIVKFIEDNGGVESFMRYEAGFQNNLGKARDILSAIGKTLRRQEHTAGEKKVLESVFQAAAWPMRKTEVILRSHSWLSHYIQARKHLESNGLKLRDNDPWLIDMANRGVAATQFLYNNANRPLFASTSLGKIFSRFQLWGWNSVALRRDVYRAAKDIGFKPNSPELDKLKRFVLADTFILALASVFPASLFEANLAPPFSWMEDLGNFFFGNSEEKERAFWGQLPYPANIAQIVSPPSSRVLFNTIDFALTMDTEKFWGDGLIPRGTFTSWLPFGRLYQSTLKTIESPSMLVENFTGIPTHRMDRYLQKHKKETAPTTKFSPLLQLLSGE